MENKLVTNAICKELEWFLPPNKQPQLQVWWLHFAATQVLKALHGQVHTGHFTAVFGMPFLQVPGGLRLFLFVQIQGQGSNNNSLIAEMGCLF